MGQQGVATALKLGVIEIDVDHVHRWIGEHPQQVLGIIEQEQALAPEQVHLFSLEPQADMTNQQLYYALTEGQSASVETLNTFIGTQAGKILDITSDRLEEFLADGPEFRVINASYSKSRFVIYRNVETILMHNLALRQQVLGIVTSVRVMRQEIVRYVDQQLAENRFFAQALSRYRRTTRQAITQGITVVVAAGNDHQTLLTWGQGVDFDPTADLNLLALSEHVLVVAAAETVGHNQYQLAQLSSRGAGRYQPVVAALGMRLQVGQFTGLSGTSYATPKVAVAVLEMIQVNPTLTFEEIRWILQQTAMLMPGSVGFLDKTWAVTLAEAMLANEPVLQQAA